MTNQRCLYQQRERTYLYLPTQGKKKIINKSREGVEKGEEGSEKKGEQTHEQNRSVLLAAYVCGRVFNFLLC